MLRVPAAAEAIPPGSLSRSFRRRALRATFYTGGVVATAAGFHTVIAGGNSLPDEGRANPRPHRVQLALLGIELGAPPVMVALAGAAGDTQPETRG
jgi:hypothetical protein